MESLKPTWKSVVYETLRILPHATAAGRHDLHDQLLAIGHRADRFVQLRSLLVKELETVLPFEGPTGVLMEKDGVAYRAVWVPVGGVICNTLTPMTNEEPKEPKKTKSLSYLPFPNPTNLAWLDKGKGGGE